MLRRMFDSEEYAVAYDRAGVPMAFSLAPQSMAEDVETN